MGNRITIAVEFDFKGQHYAPSASIDLDQIMRSNGTIPNLCSSLARLNDIDLYSYEFEVMESLEMQFTNAQGVAAECLQNGVFDKEEFVKRWHQEQQLKALSEVAKQYLQIEVLAQQPQLQAALLAAFELGRKMRPCG